MKETRKAGVLCHISSLPGEYGIGSLGKEAFRLAKNLAASGVKIWQILPLVQTGYGDSPYQSVSYNSGNPYFIDLEFLMKEKLLTKEEVKGAQRKRGERIDYADLYETRYPLLRRAFSRFNFDGEIFRSWVKQGKYEDYALFMTAKTVFGGAFFEWEEPLKRHDPEALERLRTAYHEEYLFWHFLQFQFHRQWQNLKNYCNAHGIAILGDLPLYVAYDSADVWAHPTLFKLDETLRPTKVAGVPPDYFSENGQLWGNPVYDWAVHEGEGFRWWKKRLSDALSTYDYVRIDHFRGLDRYYEIPYGAETAREGAWQEGPKEKLFEGLEGQERIIAEDLGTIDGGVLALLHKLGFPGMKVLLFAFDGNEENWHLPQNFGENCVVYTGTHDNDTVMGYVDSLTAEEYFLFRSRIAAELERQKIFVKLGPHGECLPEALAHIALASRARIAVVPMQDILELGSEDRMNSPGTSEGNWQFRLQKQPSARAFRRLKKMIKIYRR
ncbi:MAG: 4-alpha-glucanotransferase [Clostridia bacterium]|nr:4-alpha-glucanotransferase [Clostridia bacterium]